MKKILLIEDETKTASFIQRGLSETGYAVDVREDGETGFQAALEGDYDLIIIDVMLPKKDGWTLISELRAAGKNTLSLFLTARDSLTDRLKGLNSGGDGYLVKPFAFSELIANVRVLLKRTLPKNTNLIQIADLEIDLLEHRAFRRGQRLDLTPKEFSLLLFLARRPAEVISRKTLSEKVWDMNFDSGTNVVDVHIRRLRSKIDDPFEPKLIHTVRGMGYTLSDKDPHT